MIVAVSGFSVVGRPCNSSRFCWQLCLVQEVGAALTHFVFSTQNLAQTMSQTILASRDCQVQAQVQAQT